MVVGSSPSARRQEKREEKNQKVDPGAQRDEDGIKKT
jgi:hypothetical protein